jgi:hypothetical protein
MKTIKITVTEANEMRNKYLNATAKQRLGISGYQMVSDYGWYFSKETDRAILLTGFNEHGTYAQKEIEDVKLWLPKSQIKVFEYVDTDVDDYDSKKTYLMIFVKTWLFNEEKNNIELTHQKSYSY